MKLHVHGPCPIHRRSFEPVAQPLFPFFRMKAADPESTLTNAAEAV
jgi:hypothetical protein